MLLNMVIEFVDLPIRQMVIFYSYVTGWWYTYPSEKSWSSSVGMMKFPTVSGKS